MEHFLETWGLLAVFVVNLLSATGIPAGSEWATVGAGALASGHLTHGSHPHLGLVIIVAIAGDLLGSYLGYSIGRFGGRPLVDRFGKYVLLTHKDLDRAEVWFARRGDPIVVVGKVVPLLRSFISLAAGLGEMSVGKFVLFTSIGGTVFSVALCFLGYSLGSSWHRVITASSTAGYIIGAVTVILLALVVTHRISAMRKEVNRPT